MVILKFNPFPFMQTSRLNLRQLEAGDYNEIFFFRSDEGHNKYIDRPKANSLDEAKSWIEKIINGVRNNEAVFWVLTLRGSTKLMGTISLWNISKEECKAEIGYELLPHYQGNGIMNEAVPAVIEYGFEEMKLNEIEAYTHMENSKSVSLLERNNFTRNKKQEEQVEKPGHMIIYSLDKKSWQAKK